VIRFEAPVHDLKTLLPRVVFDSMGTRGASATRCINKLFRAIRPLEVPASLTEAARQDLTNGPLVRRALVEMAGVGAPSLDATSFRFEIKRDERGLHVESDVDFAKFRGIGEFEKFDVGHLIASFGAARMQAHAAATFGGEIATDPTTSIVLRATVSDLTRRRSASASGIADFEELVLDQAGAIRDAINSGRRSFDEFEGLLERAARFRGWLKNQPHDKKLVKAYFDEVTRDSWVASEPGKAARWFFLNAIGMTASLLTGSDVSGTILAGALSMADTFWLENFAKGWRPDQFVNGALKGFAEAD
jgi:hypothetical protein